MIYVELIARMLTYPKEVLATYSQYFGKIQFKDVIAQDIVRAILESWRLFGEAKIDYLKEKFKDRDDVDLFMKRVSEVQVEGDAKFVVWWIGKALSDMVLSEIKKGELDLGKLRDLVVLASELKDVSEGKILPVEVWDFTSEVGRRLEQKEIDQRVLKTGISLLDEKLKMSDGTLTVFCAPWKRYKSILLTNIGAAALAQGLSVFHVNYEGKKTIWETRYDACLSGVAISRLYAQLSEAERSRIVQVYKNLEKKNARLYLMGGLPQSIGYLEINAELESLKKQGIEFDVIIVDYLNLMKPSKSSAEDWKEQGQSAWDLVSFARRGYITVTAVQAKMEAATRELLKVNDMGRSVVIAQACSSMVAINQNQTEKEQGCIRLSPLAFREGEITKSSIPVEMCLWKMRISRELDKILNPLGDTERVEEF